jgi:hypothetical protein
VSAALKPQHHDKVKIFYEYTYGKLSSSRTNTKAMEAEIHAFWAFAQISSDVKGISYLA